MCISVGWLFFFSFSCFFFCFYFFLQKKWSPLAMRFISFLLWVSPWTVEGQGIRSHRQLEEITLRYTHTHLPHTLETHDICFKHTHTHTLGRHDAVSRTHSNWGRLQRQKGKETNSSLILFHSTNILTLKMWHTHTHTHTPSDSKIHKPLTRMRHWSRTMLHYTWHSEDVGGGQNVSIAHCGTFKGIKRGRLGIIRTKSKTTPKGCYHDVPFPLLHSQRVYNSDCFVSYSL